MIKAGQDAQAIKEVFKQGKREIILEKRLKKVGEYETDDGMRLILRENGDGQIIGHLEEDLEIQGENGDLKNLIKILKTITDVKVTDRKYISGPNGEGEKKLVAELKIGRIKKFSGLGGELLKQIKLYKNLQNALKKRTNEIEKERLAFPDCALNDIEFFTHLGIEEKYRKTKNLLEVADFLRELYGFIEIETGITRKEILSSNSKTSEVARERAIVAYLLRNRFDFLSYNNIGKILGDIKPKNHATIIFGLRRFNEKDFDPEFYKTRDPLTLYKKAKESYILPPRLLGKEKLKS